VADDQVVNRLRPRPTALARALPEDTDLLGPAPMLRVRNRHRRRLLLKVSDREATVAAVRDTVERLAADRWREGMFLGALGALAFWVFGELEA
jgi:primosomal protein N'